MDRNLVNADTIGQAILDKKVEVEALLEQNGYAKFTWKEGNKISKLLLQWGYNSGVGIITLPTAYSNVNFIPQMNLACNVSGGYVLNVGLAEQYQL